MLGCVDERHSVRGCGQAEEAGSQQPCRPQAVRATAARLIAAHPGKRDKYVVSFLSLVWIMESSKIVLAYYYYQCCGSLVIRIRGSVILNYGSGPRIWPDQDLP